MLRVIVNNSRALVTFRHYQKGNTIRELKGKIRSTPTKTSIKIDEECHIEDEFGSFINHSCRPSVKISNGKIIAVRNIKVGEEITFNYLHNEDILSNPFTCFECGESVTGEQKMLCKN